MHEAVSRTTAGRVAAALFLVSGAVTLVSVVLPAPPTLNAPAVAACGLIAMLAAIPAWFAPWDRLPRRAMLIMVSLALPLISVHNVVGGSDPYRWGLFYVVLSAWLGLAQPRGTFLWMSPLLVISYALPLILFSHPLWALSSTLYAIPVCGLVAESVAWAIDRAGRAQQALSDSESRLRYLAHHDPLTGLSNRADFLMQLERLLADQAGLGLLFVDIDDFKDVNDRFGHAAGDQLLQHVANCLLSAVRPDDVVARLGGDEFTVILAGVASRQEAERVAARIRQTLLAPTPELASPVRASIGITISAPDESGDVLLRRADAAMYAAKRRTKRSTLAQLAA
jgi:diguanylate cyclase (GGDEF)-like protein